MSAIEMLSYLKMPKILVHGPKYWHRYLYWKWNFPITRFVRRSVGWLVNWSICHDFLKGWKDSLPTLLFYRSTLFPVFSFLFILNLFSIPSLRSSFSLAKRWGPDLGKNNGGYKKRYRYKGYHHKMYRSKRYYYKSCRLQKVKGISNKRYRQKKVSIWLNKKSTILW